ncbi:DUF3237 domain-containing protein [Halobaculum sp. P14]|uniref:DUF3237 domain-containing protein n=1 Tax=Halobaculum sp. P14 TaxID=3421638 RepID=UPI003EB98B78
MGADRNHDDELLDPSFEHVMDLDIEVADPIEIGETGDGQRRIIEITSGTVSGRVDGEILPGGADYQLYRTERPTELVAKYAFETDDGARVYVENRGIRWAPPTVSERIRDGESVDPAEVYFRSVPEFETADPDLQWLTRSIFVATGVRQPNGVKLAVFRVA